MYPPQEVVAEAYPNYLLARIEEALSFSPDWPTKSRFIEGLSKWHERNEILEYKLGPLEVTENETFDKATRVAVPILSMKIRNRTTVQTVTEPEWKDGVRNIVEIVLDKRETPQGLRWYIVAGGPAASDLESTGWLKLPRKKVADSPTIILKKAVVVQVVSDGQVVNERIIFADDPNRR